MVLNQTTLHARIVNPKGVQLCTAVGVKYLTSALHGTAPGKKGCI